MGQQQLLLLTLATIIVGFATLGGIQAFDRYRKQSTADHMKQVALEIAANVQVYARKSDLHRPANSTSSNPLVIDFGELGQYSTNGAAGDGDYEDDVAVYSLNGNDTLPGDYDADACPENGAVNTVEAFNDTYKVSVCVGIAGLTAADLETGVIMGE